MHPIHASSSSSSLVSSPEGDLTPADRYDRQVRLWGNGEQQLLHAAHVVVLGLCDAVVSTIKHLLLSGVGHITMVMETKAKTTHEIPHETGEKGRKKKRRKAWKGRTTHTTSIPDCACNFFLSSEDINRFHQAKETAGKEEEEQEKEPIRHKKKERGVSPWSIASSLQQGPFAMLNPNTRLRLLSWPSSLSEWGQQWARTMRRLGKHRSPKSTSRFERSRTSPTCSSCDGCRMSEKRRRKKRIDPQKTTTLSAGVLHLLPSLFLVTRDYPDWSPLSPLARMAHALQIPVVYVESHGFIGGWICVRVGTAESTLRGCYLSPPPPPPKKNISTETTRASFMTKEKKEKEGKVNIKKRIKHTKQKESRNPSSSFSHTSCVGAVPLPFLTWSSAHHAPPRLVFQGLASLPSSETSSPEPEDTPPSSVIVNVLPTASHRLGGGHERETAAPVDLRLCTPFPALRGWLETHLPPLYSPTAVHQTAAAVPVASPPFLVVLYAAYQRWSEKKKRQHAREKREPREGSGEEVDMQPHVAALHPPLPSTAEEFHALRVEICSLFREQDRETERTTPYLPRWLTAESVREALARCTPRFFQRSCVYPPDRLRPYHLRDALFHPFLFKMEEAGNKKEEKERQGVLKRRNAETERMYLQTSLWNIRWWYKQQQTSSFASEYGIRENRDLVKEGMASKETFLPLPSSCSSTGSGETTIRAALSSPARNPPADDTTVQKKASPHHHYSHSPPSLPQLSSLHLLPFQRQLLGWYLLCSIRAFYLSPFSSPLASSSVGAAFLPYQNKVPCLPFDGMLPTLHTHPAWEGELRELYTRKHVLDLQWVVAHAWETFTQDWHALLDEEEKEEEAKKGGEKMHTEEPQNAENQNGKSCREWRSIPFFPGKERDTPFHSPAASSLLPTSTFFLFLFHTSPRQVQMMSSPRTEKASYPAVLQHQRRSSSCSASSSFLSKRTEWHSFLYTQMETRLRLRQAFFELGQEMISRVWTLRLVPSTPLILSDGRCGAGLQNFVTPPPPSSPLQKEEGMESPTSFTVKMVEEHANERKKQSREGVTPLSSSCTTTRFDTSRWVWEHVHFPSLVRSLIRQHSFLHSVPPSSSFSFNKENIVFPLLSPESMDAFFAALLQVVRERLGKSARREERHKRRWRKKKPNDPQRLQEVTERETESPGMHDSSRSASLLGSGRIETTLEQKVDARPRKKKKPHLTSLRKEVTGVEDRGPDRVKEENSEWQAHKRKQKRPEEGRTESRHSTTRKKKQKKKKDPHASSQSSHRRGWGTSPWCLLRALHGYGALPSWISEGLSLVSSGDAFSIHRYAACGSLKCTDAIRGSSLLFFCSPQEKGEKASVHSGTEELLLIPSLDGKEDEEVLTNPPESSGNKNGTTTFFSSSTSPSPPPQPQEWTRFFHFLYSCTREVWEQQEVEVPSVSAAVGALAAQEVVKLLQQHRVPACGVEGIFYSGYSNTVRTWNTGGG